MSDLSDAIAALTPSRYYILGTDSSGTMVEAGGGTDGTWTDQPTFGQPALLPGASASALFNGTGDRGTFGGLDIGSGDWTVHIVAQGSGGASHPNRDFAWTTLYGSDRLAFLARDGTYMYGYAGAGSSGNQARVAKDGDPHQWVLQYHPHATTGYIRLWRDGVQVDEQTGAITWSGFPTTHYVGADYTGSGQLWVGSLSDLALWVGTILTEDQIEGLWAAALTGEPAIASARVTQVVRDAVTGGESIARITQLVRDVVGSDVSAARVTQLVRDVVIQANVPASVRVSQLVRDVVVENVPRPGIASRSQWS